MEFVIKQSWYLYMLTNLLFALTILPKKSRWTPLISSWVILGSSIWRITIQLYKLKLDLFFYRKFVNEEFYCKLEPLHIVHWSKLYLCWSSMGYTATIVLTKSFHCKESKLQIQFLTFEVAFHFGALRTILTWKGWKLTAVEKQMPTDEVYATRTVLWVHHSCYWRRHQCELS